MAKNFTSFHLLDDPFFSTPRTDKPVFWAGCEKYKKELESVLEISLVTLPSRIIINHGEWGMGKTHAMRYFSNQKNIENLCKKIGVEREPLSLDLILPRNNVFESLYTDIIIQIGIDRISDIVKKIQKHLTEKTPVISEDALRKELKLITNDEKLSKVLSCLVEGKKDSVERYLLFNARNKDLDQLSVPIGISTTMEILRTLNGILKLLICGSQNIKPEYSKIIIWIDQIENIVDFSGKEIVEIQEFLRDIMDIMSANLVIFLNASSRPDQTIEDFLTYLGDAVSMRIYKKLHIPPMIESEALTYINETLNNDYNRSKEDKKLCGSNLFFPFNENSVKYVLKLIKQDKTYLSPRWINDFLSNILHIAFQNEIVMKKLDKMTTTIDEQFIITNKEKIVSSSTGKS